MRFLFCATLSAWLALAAAVHGQLSGSYALNFSAAQVPVWDLSGTYTRSNGTATATNVAEQILNHAPDGRITGSGTATVQDEANDIHAVEIVSGRVTGGAKKPVQLNASGNGTFGGKVRGASLSGTFSGTLAMTLDPTNRVLAGRETATLCIPGRVCQTVSTNSSFALQPNMDGSWSLALTLGTTNNTVTGSGTATLSNGRTVPVTVRGKFTPATQVSKLKVSANGAAMNLVLDAAGQVQSVRGKFFGQKLLFP